MPAAWLTDLVQPGRSLHEFGSGVLSAVPLGERGASYDRRAAMYDLLVGKDLYNRLVWSCSTASYTDFAKAALSDGAGPFLDVGCGSAVFTASAYRSTDRPLVLIDRSLAMLTRARTRLGVGGQELSQIALIQADLFDLPFRRQAFATVACFGLLHLFDDLAATVGCLNDQRAAGGSLYATSLVGETTISRRALALLHRGGEAADPRSEAALVVAVRAVLDAPVHARREGAMAFLTA